MKSALRAKGGAGKDDRKAISEQLRLGQELRAKVPCPRVHAKWCSACDTKWLYFRRKTSVEFFLSRQDEHQPCAMIIIRYRGRTSGQALLIATDDSSCWISPAVEESIDRCSKNHGGVLLVGLALHLTGQPRGGERRRYYPVPLRVAWQGIWLCKPRQELLLGEERDSSPFRC